MKVKSGFTLVEILVVAMIIAILAAIAFVHDAEAQTRGKVSRAMADMRALGTALESYHVDRDNDPDVPVQTSFSHPSKLGIMVPEYSAAALALLSTPVAYLANPLMPDPFRQEKSLPPYGYCQTRAVMEPVEQAGGISSFEDAMLGVACASGDAERFPSHRWILQSVGPDGKNFPLQGTRESMFPLAFSALTNRQSLSYIYDPTNGTISPGDIAMTARGFLK
jgi:prepilin-type N-terminal cleavage/methylation domain-containing protein